MFHKKKSAVYFFILSSFLFSLKILNFVSYKTCKVFHEMSDLLIGEDPKE
jgi:hypothetical protein